MSLSRQLFLVLHRYLGLVIAGFLLLAGTTGSVLVFYDELDAALNPSLVLAQAPHANAIPIDPLLLREHVQARYPVARVDFVELSPTPGHATLFRLKGETEQITAALPNDEVLVNPYTGDIQGERKWGDVEQGRKSLMSFIFRLHRTLALGKSGEFFMGVIALLWTFNCIFGAWLTFPPVRRARKPTSEGKAKHGRPWLARWWQSWKVQRNSGAYKISFDLHRAGGLWLWAMLFVIAWSGVAFNLKPVYNPVMQSLFSVQDGQNLPLLPKPLLEPSIDWRQARDIGRALMMLEATKHDFRVLREYRLIYDPARGIYRYVVRSDRDVRDIGGVTAVFIDGITGARLAAYIPTGVASGDTLRSWIGSLHMAAVWGMPYKIFMFCMGFVVATLSATGLVIWWHKRSSRRKSRANTSAQAATGRVSAAQA